MATGIEDLTARAKQLIAERSYQDAVRACRRVLLSRPDETPVRILLGKALLALRRYDEVRAEMMAVLRTEPREAAAHRLLGEGYLRSGDPHKARDSILRALELDSSDDEARELLGEIEEETAPISATIDRWFDPEAVATVQTSPPPFEEEHTGPVQIPFFSDEESSIEVDPSLVAEAQGARPVAGPPRPVAAPPRRGGASTIPPPPASRPPRPGSAGPPRRATLRAPSAGPPLASSRGDSIAEETAAHRPAARRTSLPRPAPVPEVTDELSLDEVESLPGLDDVEELEGEPTQARAEPFGYGHGALDGADTLQRDTDDLPELDEERTVARPDRMPVAYYPEPPRGPSAFGAPRSPEPARFPDDPVLAPPGATDFPDQPRQRRPPPARRGAVPASSPASDPSRGTPTPHAVERAEHATPHTGRTQRAASRAGRIALWSAVLVVPVLLGVAAFLGVRYWMDENASEEVSAAAVRASDDGLRESLESAIQVAEKHGLDDPEDVALRARLLATLVMDHGEDRAAEVQELLAQLSGPDANLPDVRVAEAYLRIARGDVPGAQEALDSAEGESAELWRARALVLLAGRDVTRAVTAARAAVTERPTSPRHVALLALLMALDRDTSAATEALAGVPGGDGSPAVRLARARILLESGSDPRGAASEAGVVLEELGSVASKHQKAWAHLVRARHAAASGDEPAARREATGAAELRPTWDEAFALSLAETFLRLAAPSDAQEVLSTLPEQSQEPQRRATLEAEVALAVGEIDAAARALEQAPDDAQTAFLRGRIQEERGDLDAARTLYERAMEDPRESVRARGRLGAIALGAGDSARAVELLTPAAEREPANLEVVPVLVRALLATERVERASEVVGFALQRREDAVELLSAKAQVDLAQGHTEAALATLRRVVEQRPDDPEVHATLGEAARLAGEPDRAREAFDKALELRDDHQGALIGLAQLAVDEGDDEAARAAIERAESAGARGRALDRVRAHLLVRQGAGEEAVETLSELAEDTEDAALWVALGWAQTQAERDRDATRSFTRALRIDEDEPEAHLGMALLQTRAGALSRVARSIGAAERAMRQRGLGPRFEARILAARGRLRFELGDFGDATANAREALSKDAECAEAHLLLANIAIERGDDPIPHLRSAVAGHAPLPEALGRLAVRLPRGEEACDLARRYMRAAPNGYDAPDVQDVIDRCR